MSFNLFGVQITVSYPFLAVLTVFLSLDRTGLGGCMLSAALLHELGHLAVMAWYHQMPNRISFLSFGIRIEKPQSIALSYGREIFLFLAGPLVNLTAAALSMLSAGGTLTQLAQVHLVLGLFNLLPIGALDGGMVVANLARRFASPHVAQAIATVVSLLFLTPAFGAALLMAFRGQGNITMIVTLFYLAATIFSGTGARNCI